MRELTVDEVNEVAGGRDRFTASASEYGAYESTMGLIGNFIDGFVTGLVAGFESEQ